MLQKSVGSVVLVFMFSQLYVWFVFITLSRLDERFMSFHVESFGYAVRVFSLSQLDVWFVFSG